MTQEDKELVLKDLSSRLPYGVKILHKGWNYEWDDELSTIERVVGIDEEFIYTKVIDVRSGEEYKDDKWPISTFDDKLFLRPMSSMTEKEIQIYHKKNQTSRIGGMEVPIQYHLYRTQECNDWLNKHMFDYRGLIPKGLALAAQKGMYK